MLDQVGLHLPGPEPLDVRLDRGRRGGETRALVLSRDLVRHPHERRDGVLPRQSVVLDQAEITR